MVLSQKLWTHQRHPIITADTRYLELRLPRRSVSRPPTLACYHRVAGPLPLYRASRPPTLVCHHRVAGPLLPRRVSRPLTRVWYHRVAVRLPNVALIMTRPKEP